MSSTVLIVGGVGLFIVGLVVAGGWRSETLRVGNTGVSVFEGKKGSGTVSYLRIRQRRGDP